MSDSIMNEQFLDGADDENKQIPRVSHEIENLVFRGGGVKGIAYCGALRVMADAGLLHNIKRYAGSSAGAITAALLAIGYNAQELEAIFSNQNITSFKDAKTGVIAKAERLFQNFALYEGKYFTEWIGKLISAKADINITFQQVFTTYRKELVITGTCLTHMEMHYFSPRTSPDMTIREALRISMSIPIFFEPVKMDDHLFVDGGLGDNFPLCIFDTDTLQHEDGRHAEVNMKTLGLFLQEDSTRQSVTRKIKHMKDFIACLLDTVKMRIAQLALKPGDEKRILFINTHFVNSTKFKISDEEKELLYYEGQKAAKAHFFTSSTPDINTENERTSRLIVQLKEGLELKRRPWANIYCVLTLDKVKQQSTSKVRTSHPIWNENFIFHVRDETETLQLEVIESELVRTPKQLKVQNILLSSLENGHPTEKCIEFEKGKVTLIVTLSK